MTVTEMTPEQLRESITVDPLRVIAAALVEIASTLASIDRHDSMRFNEESKRGFR